jgi:hypothetical protein
MTTPKGPTLILILVVVLLVAAALVYGVRRRDKKEKAAAAAALRDIVGAPLTQQLAPPGGFTLEQQVVLGENA